MAKYSQRVAMLFGSHILLLLLTLSCFAGGVALFAAPAHDALASYGARIQEVQTLHKFHSSLLQLRTATLMARRQEAGRRDGDAARAARDRAATTYNALSNRPKMDALDPGAFLGWLELARRSASTGEPRSAELFQRWERSFDEIEAAIEAREADLALGVDELQSSREALWRDFIVSVGAGCFLALLFLSGWSAFIFQRLASTMQWRKGLPTDTVTGMLSRMALADAAEAVESGSLILIKLDGLADVERTHGEAGRDAVLAAFSRAAKHGIRQVDFSGRVSGDEFVILLPQSSVAIAMQAMKRIVNRFQQHPAKIPEPLSCTVNYGVAAHNGDIEESLIRADEDLYRNNTRMRRSAQKAPAVEPVGPNEAIAPPAESEAASPSALPSPAPIETEHKSQPPGTEHKPASAKRRGGRKHRAKGVSDAGYDDWLDDPKFRGD